MHDPPVPVRVAVLNDYPIIVFGVAGMLAPYRDRIEVVELDTRTLPEIDDVDLLLFDTFGYLDGYGIDLVDVIRPGGPKVVLFTWTADAGLIQRARELGAAGVLAKGLAPVDLVTSLEDLHAGAVVTTELSELGLIEGWGQWPAQDVGLSSREAEVLALIAHGLSNRDIGRVLYLGVNSIKTYVRTTYAKIGVRSRSQAVIWAVEHGFAPRIERAISEAHRDPPVRGSPTP